ncbi:MAG: hypothetical protein ABJC19_00045 [Gemmatimonadota bacterium]
MPAIRRPLIGRLAAALVALPCLALSAQSASPCAGKPLCADNREFVAVLTDVRLSRVGTSDRVVTATLRITNLTTQPLILGYVDQSAVSIDDRGNRYGAYGDDAVRGLGIIRASTFDPKFALAGNETADARIEMRWRPESRGAIYGSVFDMELALRRIDPVTAQQYRVGREYSLAFRGITEGSRNGQIAAAAAAAAGPTAAPASATPPSGPAADPCLGKSRCFATPGFVAEVVNARDSREGTYRDHVVRITVKVHNTSPARLILGYKSGSSVVIDNLGNRFYWGRAGTYDLSASGIGTVTGQKADPGFALDPGESRSATFTLVRFRPGNTATGTAFSWDVVLTQLEPLSGGQIRSVRDFALSFPDLAPNASDAARGAASDAGKSLINDVLKRVRKP